MAPDEESKTSSSLRNFRKGLYNIILHVSRLAGLLIGYISGNLSLALHEFGVALSRLLEELGYIISASLPRFPVLIHQYQLKYVAALERLTITAYNRIKIFVAERQRRLERPPSATAVYMQTRLRQAALATVYLATGLVAYLAFSGAEAGTAITLAIGGSGVLWLDYFLLKLRVRRGYFGRNRAEAEELTGFLYDRYGKGDGGEPPPTAAWLPPETEDEATAAAGGKAHAHG